MLLHGPVIGGGARFRPMLAPATASFHLQSTTPFLHYVRPGFRHFHIESDQVTRMPVPCGCCHRAIEKAHLLRKYRIARPQC